MTLTSRRILARLAATAAVVAFAALHPSAVHASGFEGVLYDGGYANTSGWNMGGSLFFSKVSIKEERHGTSPGLVVGGNVGTKGTQAWAGLSVIGTMGTADVRAVLTRPWTDRQGTSSDATYLGAEVGFGLGHRFTIGYAKRVTGPSTAAAHMVTWSLGLEIPVRR